MKPEGALVEMTGADALRTGDTVTLRSASMEAVLCPRLGRLVVLRLTRVEPPVDVLVPLTSWPAEPRRWAKAGAYPLIPYSNRIKESMLRHDGQVYMFDPHPEASPHTLHGHTHLLPWRISRAEADQVEMHVAVSPGPHWPWSFEAWQIFKLTPAGITVELGIRNTDDRSFPAGLGWHPYLSWSENDRLQHDAAGWWPHEEDFFPTGERVALSGFDPLRTEVTAYLDDWNTVEIVRSDGRNLTLTAGGCLSHLVVHKPQGAGYICIEPVSHVTDAFNASVDRDRAGVRVLEPGQSLTGWVAIAIHDGKPREPERSH